MCVIHMSNNSKKYSVTYHLLIIYLQNITIYFSSKKSSEVPLIENKSGNRLPLFWIYYF